MSTRKLTRSDARAMILADCRQFVEDTPWDEPGHLWDQRTEELAKALDYKAGTDISEKAMGDLRELLTTLEEIQSLENGTHYRIVTNRALTIDNRPDLADELNRTLEDNVTEVLSVGAFKATDDALKAAA